MENSSNSPGDEHGAVVGVGAANQEQPGVERALRHAGQRLDHAQRIAERARHRGELPALERVG